MNGVFGLSPVNFDLKTNNYAPSISELHSNFVDNMIF